MQWLLQLLIPFNNNLEKMPQWLAYLYFNFKNRKKKVEIDPDQIEYSTAIGMGMVAFVLVSSVVITLIYPQDREGWKQAQNNMTWIGFILIIIGFSFTEYKFRQKKKRLAAQSEIENQDSNWFTHTTHFSFSVGERSRTIIFHFSLFIFHFNTPP